MTPPLAIVQARLGSRRLPRKMLADLGGRPLVWWAWHAACEAFGANHTVVALPEKDKELAHVVEGFGGRVFRWAGSESDVLGRFHACAHRYRWKADSVIVRVTADDPFKVPEMMRRVANGERMPVELGAEAFTLAMIDLANIWVTDLDKREHITHAIFPDNPPPAAPPGIWTVDTAEDLADARRVVDVGTTDMPDLALNAGAIG